jgi:putative membrane protein
MGALEMCGFDHMWWGGGLFMMIFWTVLLIAIVLWIFKTVQSQKNGPTSATLKYETPLYLLKKRYARGEITKDEFDNMKKDLQE